jgi:hypothetical protein
MVKNVIHNIDPGSLPWLGITKIFCIYIVVGARRGSSFIVSMQKLNKSVDKAKFPRHTK